MGEEGRFRPGHRPAHRTDRKEAVLARSPRHAGSGLLMAQRPHEAEAVLRKALALGNRNASHHGALGWALVQLGRLDEALPVAEEANRRAPRGLRGLLSVLRADGAPRPGQRSGPALRFPQAKFDPAPEVESAGIPRTSRCKVRVCPLDDERCWFRMSEIQGTRRESSTTGVAFVPFSLRGETAMPAPSGLIEAYLEGPVTLRRAVVDFSSGLAEHSRP